MADARLDRLGFHRGISADMSQVMQELSKEQSNGTISKDIHVEEGSDAVLPCPIPQGQADQQTKVTWIKLGHYDLLTVGLTTYSGNPRLKPFHDKNSKEGTKREEPLRIVCHSPKWPYEMRKNNGEKEFQNIPAQAKNEEDNHVLSPGMSPGNVIRGKESLK
ncbi:unnamed protein product [Darwinula stevensoni]|uniref:Ig-like domain-containing protein n=1 Tax=Darwinula stevensoni TaxID=69355 RepID=A0A7R8WZA7_9CRUS|nr:unnamed protein product [Darwinula stevensoni]CAG0879944.1 unnamed protein product [Darwinula stevensoni]